MSIIDAGLIMWQQPYFTEVTNIEGWSIRLTPENRICLKSPGKDGDIYFPFRLRQNRVSPIGFDRRPGVNPPAAVLDKLRAMFDALVKHRTRAAREEICEDLWEAN
jgi:hypothetical protein